MIESREDNLLLILRDLRAQGIRYKLVNGVFKYDKTTLHDDLIKEAIDVCRPGLSYILRLKEGLCIDCGIVKSERPQRDKRYCEKCYWSRVNPIMERLRQTDTETKRASKSVQANAKKEEDEQCLSLE